MTKIEVYRKNEEREEEEEEGKERNGKRTIKKKKNEKKIHEFTISSFFLNEIPHSEGKKKNEKIEKYHVCIFIKTRICTSTI